MWFKCYEDENYEYCKISDTQIDNTYTCYAHMSRRNVTIGQTVARGQIIGYVGQSGWATGPHLHFEIRSDNRTVNPALVLNF